MAADPIIHCLQELTDYDCFERLCSSIMAGLGFKNIEPMGGRSDKGRDALYTCKATGERIIFAYTVRQDWKKKLSQDCKTVRENGHDCDRLIFVCTSGLTAGQKDNARESTAKEFGWELEIYDLERLRVQLVGEQRYLVPQHPQIFCPPWFSVRGGVSTSFGRDIIVIDHDESDHGFAIWLCRRLQICGYSVWCFGVAPMAGETADDTVRVLIENRAERYIPVLSRASCSNPDFLARCALASNKEGLVIPVALEEYAESLVGKRMSNLQPADFRAGWAEGLRMLLDQLDVQRITRRYGSALGREVALRSYVPEPVTLHSAETVYSNTFEVVQVPKILKCYESPLQLSDAQEKELRMSWNYSVLKGRIFAAFEEPPKESGLAWKRELMWDSAKDVYGRLTINVVKELIRRGVEAVCVEKGLEWCDERGVYFFPQEPSTPKRNIRYEKPNGQTSPVGVTGYRQWGSGEKATRFFYQLAPRFRVSMDPEGTFWLTVHVYVRTTDEDGTPFTGKAIGKRRKKVTKSWYNHHFLARTLGITQHLATEDRQIVIGEGNQRIIVDTTPMTWQCPIAVDEEAVDRVGDFQEELAALARWDDESEEDTEDEVDD